MDPLVATWDSAGQTTGQRGTADMPIKMGRGKARDGGCADKRWGRGKARDSRYADKNGARESAGQRGTADMPLK